MIRQTAPYGAGASSFNASPGPTVPFGAPAPPAGLGGVLPTGITSGPGVGYANLGMSFPTDGFYRSSANPGWPTNETGATFFCVLQRQGGKRTSPPHDCQKLS